MGTVVLTASAAVFVWAVAGLIRPTWACLPSRAASVGVWVLSVVLFIIGGALMPDSTPEQTEQSAAVGSQSVPPPTPAVTLNGDATASERPATSPTDTPCTPTELSPAAAAPSAGIQEGMTGAVDTDRARRETRDRVQSDDAASIDEALFHGMARAAVIQNVEPNTLGVGGREFRVKQNPAALGGAFVYDPRDVFSGVTRNLVWWVPSGEVAALTAYPLNGPSQLVTPGLEFPSRAGLLEVPDTSDVVAYIFRGEAMAAPQAAGSAASAPSGSFTVREYRMYRALIDTPASESEENAFRRIAREFDTTPEDAERTINMVQQTLTRNGWFGFPAQEIRRASDWNGESP